MAANNQSHPDGAPTQPLMLPDIFQGLGTTVWVLLAGLLIVLIVRRRKRGVKKSRPLFGSLRSRSFRPWDQEAELIMLCHGDKAMAERLIEHELERVPSLSRAGAALAAAARLKHDKQR